MQKNNLSIVLKRRNKSCNMYNARKVFNFSNLHEDNQSPNSYY